MSCILDCCNCYTVQVAAQPVPLQVAVPPPVVVIAAAAGGPGVGLAGGVVQIAPPMLPPIPDPVAERTEVERIVGLVAPLRLGSSSSSRSESVAHAIKGVVTIDMELRAARATGATRDEGDEESLPGMSGASFSLEKQGSAESEDAEEGAAAFGGRLTRARSLREYRSNRFCITTAPPMAISAPVSIPSTVATGASEPTLPIYIPMNAEGSTGGVVAAELPPLFSLGASVAVDPSSGSAGAIPTRVRSLELHNRTEAARRRAQEGKEKEMLFVREELEIHPPTVVVGTGAALPSKQETILGILRRTS